MNRPSTPLSRRSLIAAAAAGLPAILRSAPTRPNIIVLLSDDQRYDTIGALGNSEIRTPNLDRLVARGTSFTRAHIMGGTAPAVCVASRAMLLSGQSLFRADERLTAEVTGRGRKGPFTLFPEYFKQNGYRTFGTGKWHNRSPLYSRCFTAGENIFFGGMTDQWKVPLHNFRTQAPYPVEPDAVATRHSSELFSDAAINFLQQQSGPDPFLMYVAYTVPHDPRSAPDEFRKIYSPEKIRVPASFVPVHPFDNGELKIRDEMLAPFPRTPGVIQQHIADYYATITHMDAQIGRVIDAVNRSRHAGNTIIVFASDNGLALGRHGLLGKQSLYDHSIRVPLVMAGPSIPKGRRTSSLSYLYDLFPTLCELSGLPVPSDVEGRSLMPAIRRPDAAVRDSLLLAYRDLHRGVTTGDWKLIRYRVGSERHAQLFHLRQDPHEMKNLISTEAAKSQVQLLDKLLDEWMVKTGDPFGGIRNFIAAGTN
jgi:arylsulfatase A-like enzyme